MFSFSRKKDQSTHDTKTNNYDEDGRLLKDSNEIVVSSGFKRHTVN